jgi:pimeloyl-ACP methyl ester carboxylesterase
MTQVEVNQGTVLSVHVQGKGVPIVFLNGFGGYQQVWTEQSKRFSHQYQTITFDYRGQGESTGAMAKSLKVLASDLKIILEKLAIKEPLIVAHSMGSSVAWMFRKCFPEIKIKGIVVIDQSPKMLNTSDWSYGFTGLSTQNMDEHLKQRPILRESLNGLVPEVMRPLISAELDHPFNRTEGKHLLREHILADWREDVVVETIPILYVIASQSPYFEKSYGEWLKGRNEMINAVLIPDSGHVIMAEVPNAFNQTLRHFLKQLKM